MIAEFQFGSWLPDQTDFKNPGLEICTNTIPGPNGYEVAFGPGVTVADVTATALSAAMFERKDGTRVTACATATDLHVIVAGVVTSSSLALSLTEPVTFVRFSDWVYATCKLGTWLLSDVESATTFSAVGNAMPDGVAAAQIGDFLFFGNLTDTDTSDAPYRVRWSPFNNPTGTWATNIGTQSDYVEMPHALGPVTGIAGGTYGLIFQKRGLSRISYTGGSAPFSKQTIDEERGCIAPYSIARVGNAVYYLSHDGFYVTNGTPGEAVSRTKVWDWWKKTANQAYVENVCAAVDWPRRCVIWTVPGDDGGFKGLLYYNWETQDFSYVEQAVDWVFASGRDGLSLEQVSAIYSDLDAMPVSLDSPQFLARGRSVAVFVDGEFSQLDGAPLEAQFQTGEFQPQPGKRVFVREVAPLITTSEAVTVSLRGRARQDEMFSEDADVAVGALGFASFNFDTRYCRVAVKTSGTWMDAFGFQADFDVSGKT